MARASKRVSQNDEPSGPADRPRHPKTLRGARARQTLVDAARQVFERDGFQSARIVDIAETAKVAIGSFYTYFDSKEEIFLALMEQMQEAMVHPKAMASQRPTSLLESITNSNREYLLAYQQNAALMAVMEEVATVNPWFRQTRLSRGDAFARRNATTIVRLQRAGLADPDLEPMLAAQTLSGMVSRAAYRAFVLEDAVPLEPLVFTVTRLWLNALGVSRDVQASFELSPRHSQDLKVDADGELELSSNNVRGGRVAESGAGS